MTASYPSAIKAFTALVDDVDYMFSSHHNEKADEITAIETELGVNPSGATGTVASRLSRIDNEVASTISTGTATGVLGTIRWDTNYLYICVATNTWKRVSLGAF